MQTLEFSIGILAYGSLINDPGAEFAPLITHKIACTTPFNVEYARLSKSRSFAPTLIPVKDQGAPVNAMVLVLNNKVTLEEAKDMLWRRETRQQDVTKKYRRKSKPGADAVQVEVLNDFAGIQNVIYTSIPSNIGINAPIILADLAIKSALDEAGVKKMDGINYLINAKENGIITPLTNEYEKCILKLSGTATLEGAFAKLDEQRPLYAKKQSEERLFETQVLEISDLICKFGLEKTLQHQQFNPAELPELLKQHKEQFMKNCHEGFKKGQNKILSMMLAFEVEKDKLNLELKNAGKDKTKIKDIKAEIATINSKEDILRHLIDTIAWQMIGGQLYIARRLYRGVKGKKRLLQSNITSVIAVASEINKSESDFALITDLSCYIQTADLLIKKGDGALVFGEVKEGEKNHTVMQALKDIAESVRPIEQIMGEIKMDKHMVQHMDRSLKQFGDAVNLMSILNYDEGVDNSGRNVKIITPKEDTPRFDAVLFKLREQLETRNLWAYDVVDECLHIGLYKGPLKFAGPGILESIAKRQGGEFIIANFRHVIHSLHKPLFCLPFPREFIFDVLFGRVDLFFMLNLDKYLALFPEYGLNAEWLSRKETMKIVDKFKDRELFIHKNKAIKVTDTASGQAMYLNVGIFGKMYFEHIYPSYTAYSCHYLLQMRSENND